MTNKKSSVDKGSRKAGTPSGSDKHERQPKADFESLAVLFGLGRTSLRRKRVASGTKLPLTLSEDERKLILSTWSISGGLTDTQLRALEIAPKPELRLTLGDWDELAGWVAATSNHARGSSKLHIRACALFGRIQDILDRYTDE
ncbi:MAG: hypothetical protein NTX53_06545 [candidate division WOR-3 bacterium]|nr:hypothetical protein [candidate division WOR-3 bacterium]